MARRSVTRKGMSRSARWLLAFATTLLMVTFTFQVAALADNTGDAVLGKSIAEKDCASCHHVDMTRGEKTEGAPAFADVAKMPSATALSIKVFLRSAHGKKTMPNLILNDRELNALAEYILGLKQ